MSARAPIAFAAAAAARLAEKDGLGIATGIWCAIGALNSERERRPVDLLGRSAESGGRSRANVVGVLQNISLRARESAIGQQVGLWNYERVAQGTRSIFSRLVAFVGGRTNRALLALWPPSRPATTKECATKRVRYPVGRRSEWADQVSAGSDRPIRAKLIDWLRLRSN